MNIPRIPFAGGGQLPVLGMGLWKIEPARAAASVLAAAELGYRHFDAACDYGNEAEVGIGLREALRARVCRRDELWVTSKLWNTYHAAEHVRPAAERSLRDLQLDYLDLYLIHFPIAMRYVPFDDRYPPGWFFDPAAANPRAELARIPIHETWQAMERLVHAGLVRYIGVSNFNTGLLRDLLSYAEIPPAVLQVELHPYLTQDKLLRFSREEKIAVTAFSPLGAPSYVPLGMAQEHESIMHERVVLNVVARHGKSAAQVLLRWGVQRGTAVVPKSSRLERLRENLQIFDFELSPDEMAAISALNRNRRFNDPGDFCERAFQRFAPIYD